MSVIDICQGCGDSNHNHNDYNAFVLSERAKLAREQPALDIAVRTDHYVTVKMDDSSNLAEQVAKYHALAEAARLFDTNNFDQVWASLSFSDNRGKFEFMVGRSMTETEMEDLIS